MIRFALDLEFRSLVLLLVWIDSATSFTHTFTLAMVELDLDRVPYFTIDSKQGASYYWKCKRGTRA